MLERHTLNLDGADTVALKRLFCGDGTGRIGKKRHTAKLCWASIASQRSEGPRRYQMVNPHKHLTAKPIDFWLARGAVLVVAALQIGIVNDLTVGPRWLAPGLELALLIPLSVATAWTQKRAHKAPSTKYLVGRDAYFARDHCAGGGE